MVAHTHRSSDGRNAAIPLLESQASGSPLRTWPRVSGRGSLPVPYAA